MEVNQTRNPISSETDILIKSNEMYLHSDGFYPQSANLESKLILLDSLFNFYSVQCENFDIKVSQDEVIQFNKEIIIKQQKSGKYLQAIYIKDKWTLQLTEELDKTCLFSIQPCFKSQIINQNCVTLYNEVHISLSPNNDAQGDVQDCYLTWDSKQITFTNEVHLASNFIFETINKALSKLSYGSLIKIKLIEKNAYLAMTTKKSALIQTKNLINQSNADIQYNALFSNNLIVSWQEQEQTSEFDLWRIYHPQKAFQQINLNDSFYLQNVASNQYISLTTIVNNFEEASLFQFQEINANNHFISGFIVHQDKYFTSSLLHQQNSLFYQLEYKSQVTKEDQLLLEVQSSTNQIQINWLHSAVNSIQNAIHVFTQNQELIQQSIRSNQQSNPKFESIYELCNQLIQILSDLICFCLENGFTLKIIDRNSIFNTRKNKRNQDLLKRYYIIQYLNQLLELISWDDQLTQLSDEVGFLLSEELEQSLRLRNQIQKVLKTIFLFFSAFGAYNEQNGLFILYSYSKFVQLLGCHIGAFDCLIQLFSTNQTLIPTASSLFFNQSVKQAQQNQITLIDLIFQRGQQLYGSKIRSFWSNIPKFLQILCFQNDVPFKNNQKAIGVNLKTDSFIFSKLFVNKDDQFFYLKVDDQLIELNQIYQSSVKNNLEMIQDLQQCKRFVDEYLNLVGSLCQNRNVQNIMYFKNIFLKEHLVSYVSDLKNDDYLRCKLTAILINLYIDFHPFYKIQIPKLIFKSYRQQIEEDFDEELLQINKQKINDDDIKFIESIQIIVQNYLKKNFIQQNKVNLCIRNYQMLNMYLQLLSFKLPNQNQQLKRNNNNNNKNNSFIDPKFFLYFEFLILAFSLLPDSISEKSPNQDLLQQFEQFSEDRNVFNLLAKSFIEFVYYLAEIFEKDIIHKCLNNNNPNLRDKIKISLSIPGQYIDISSTLLKLLSHKQLASQIKLKIFNLIEKLLQPKKAILLRFEQSMILEKQIEIDICKEIEEINFKLLTLLYNENNLQQYQNLIQIMKNFNQKMDGFEYLLISQRIIRILNLDQAIFDILISFTQQCRDITIRMQQSVGNYQNTNQDENVIQLCQELFKFLRIACKNNHQNKIKIMKQFDVIEQFFTIVDLGQFNLLITIYDNSFELIDCISPKTIYLLFENICVGTLRILQCVLCQQNMISHKNLVLIFQQISSRSQFNEIIGLGSQNFMKLFILDQPQSLQTLMLFGKAPYILQVQGYGFIINLIQLFISTSQSNQNEIYYNFRVQQQKDHNHQSQSNNKLHHNLLQNCFSYVNLFRLIFNLEDIFSIQIKNWQVDSSQQIQKKDLNQIFLNTILKYQLLKFLNLLLTQSEFSNYDDEYIELVKKFISYEKKLFNIQIMSLDYSTYVDNIQNQNKLKLLSKLYKDHHNIQQSEFQTISEYLIDQYFECFIFNNYSILLFDLNLNLAQKLSEYIDTVEDSSTKSKSNRNSSTLIFKKKTQSLSLIEFGTNESNNLSQKLTPFNELKVQMDDLIYSIEQHLNDKLTPDEIKENQDLLYLKQQQLKLLYLRQLDFKGFKFEQQQIHKNNLNQDLYLNPEYFNDQRIHEIIKIQGLLDSKIMKNVIEILTNTHQDQAEENFQMYKQIYQRLQLMNQNYEIQIENFPKIILPLVRILKQSLNNLISNYQGVLNILEFLWQLLDIHTYIRADYEQTVSQYIMNQKDIYKTQSEQILQNKAIKQIQNLICNEGFFEIFIQFCDSYQNLRVIPFAELGFLNQDLKDQIYYKFLLVSTKLIRGQEQANKLAQEKIISVMKNTQSNSLLKIFCLNFNSFQKLNDTQKMRNEITQDLNRILFSYEFNQTHRLERKNNSQKLGIVNIQIRFLQLIAEDHFRPAQDFLRIQEGFSQNYDMIQQLQDILFNHFVQETFINLSFDDYVLIVGCFDCMKELIQGPCHENQMKICSIQFLKLCYKLLNFDDSHGKFTAMYINLTKDQQKFQNRTREKTQGEFNKIIVSQKKTQIQQEYVEYYKKYPTYCKKILQSFRKSNNINYRMFMLSEIKYRCSTTLESLTDDQQTSSETLEKINSIISEKLVIKNIAIQYEKFKILHSSGKNYTNTIFSHLFGDQQKLSILNQEIISDSDRLWNIEETIDVDVAIRDFCDSFIIETGFSLYNILAQIFQHKNMDVLERIYEQIDSEKTQKKQLKQLLLYKLYQSWFQLQKITEMITNNVVKGKQKVAINDKIFFKIYNSKIIQQDKYLLKQHDTENTSEKEKEVEKDFYQKKLGYRALRFYATRSGSIEIILPSKQIKQVIFPLLPHCFSLNNSIKQKFSKDIDRTTQQTKVESILYNSNKTIQKLKTEYKFQLLYKRHLLVNMIAGNQEIWKQIIFYVIVMQNIMILLTNNGRYDHVLDDFLLALNIIQIVLQFVCFFIFIIRKLPYLRIKAQEIVIQRQINRIRKREIKYKYLDNSQSVVLQEDFILEKTDKFLLEQNKFVRFYQNVTDRLVLFKYIFFDYEMIYFLIFTSIAISGLFTKTLLALLLLDVFWRFPVLTAMINSVWRPIVQILLTLALFFILQYYYSLLIYDFYSEDTNYTPYCQSLLQCFSFILDVTFKKDSGSAGYVAASNGISSTYANPDFRFGILNFWEFCYYFFVISLTYSIFTGLILDSFGADREEAEELEADIKELCLVCGIDKGIIEKKTKHKKGFRFHVKNEHYVWNYIFFISYIQGKKKSEYNGIESFVDEELKRESISWFPISRSLSIIEQDDVDQIDQMIDQQIMKISQTLDTKLQERGLNKNLNQS
ncbi:unnamed protein product [Paramecium octaurelia]|uniref:RyR/IP3R Homology associated domain-containing protein n=1 Tax=Paramecium octaurelia TaxID=43137 RepID=A0A8S1U8N4_PAROT|nr:unnamed protein product [Paramecium octaurelia]